ncbi:ABC transporter substrate-binding protein [Lusitaniella coriacea LEGE 07157]|uniref:ABC transporter substrate-binding protein n=2 Tax=Lusitaniella TaxID=1983104 RepID=A0A8J7DYH4_9CYAN|nr:ABC transporter substrate-binding protein [Lusitaniella coriacea]MBE9116748.1 ABC transporter substrate-binding protein [Lusitaniella coriacea LEGE 07157]
MTNFFQWFAGMGRRGLRVCSILVCAIALSSCTGLLATSGEPVSQMVTSTLSDPKTFNYAFNQEFPHVFLRTAEGLVSENSETAEIEPNLAESWEISEDRLRIIFTLRDGLKWSDGEPLTVDDVIFTYNDIYLNEAIPTDTRDILRVGESKQLPTVRKLDERRVEFIVPEPFAPFLATTGLPLLPAHALRESVETKTPDGKLKFLTKWGVDTPPDEIIVNGPYKIKSYATGERVVFERNPHYWRKDEAGQQLPYLDELVWQIVESQDTSLLQFRSGGLDAVGTSPDFFSLLKREEKRGKFTIYNAGPAYGTTFISFNLNKGKRNGKPLVDPVKSRWFNTLEFRQAVAYAIDRQTMINNTFHGLGVLQNSPISIQSPFYFPPEKGLKTYDYNLEKAKELLLSAGFKYNNKEQLLDAEGNRVRFVAITNAENKIRVAMLAQIKQDLSKIGIEVQLNPISFSILVDKLSDSLDWECYLLGFTGGNEPNSGANIWSVDGGLHSFNQKPPAGQPALEGREVYDWEQEISDLYIQGARELDLEKRKEIYGETQRLTQEYLPAIHLVNPLSLGAVRDRFQNIKYVALPDKFWNIHEIKMSEED